MAACGATGCSADGAVGDPVDAGAADDAGAANDAGPCGGVGTWSQSATVGAPSGRYNFVYGWTGSEMIVWGGMHQVGSNMIAMFDDGGRYDPVKNAWKPLTLENAQSERLNDGGAYDPTTDTWSALATEGAPEARDGHPAVWTGSQMIVWGDASYPPGQSPGTGGLYDPSTDSWQPTSLCDAPTHRGGLGAVWTGSQMIIWGGHHAGVDVGLFAPP